MPEHSYRTRQARNLNVKAPGRGGVINGQLKTLVKSSNFPLFGARVLHVFVNSINPNSVTIDKLYQKWTSHVIASFSAIEHFIWVSDGKDMTDLVRSTKISRGGGALEKNNTASTWRFNALSWNESALSMSMSVLIICTVCADYAHWETDSGFWSDCLASSKTHAGRHLPRGCILVVLEYNHGV